MVTNTTNADCGWMGQLCTYPIICLYFIFLYDVLLCESSVYQTHRSFQQIMNAIVSVMSLVSFAVGKKVDILTRTVEYFFDDKTLQDDRDFILCL